MAGFTSQEMVDMLALRLEDIKGDAFNPSLRLTALNWAQLQLTNFIHGGYLTELEVKEFNLAAALATSDDEGSLAFSGLTYTPLGNGIQRVKINGGAWAHMVDADEVRQSINKGTNRWPLVYVQNKRIYIVADTDTPNLDIHYLREPEPMQAVFTIASFDTAPADITAPDLDARHCVADLGTPSPAFTVDEFVGQTGYNKTKESNFVVYANGADDLSLIYYDTDITYQVGDDLYFTSSDGNVTHLAYASCELNPRLHGLVVDLAESHLWRHDGKGDRSKDAYDRALAEIQVLNARYEVEKPAGVGTGRGR